MVGYSGVEGCPGLLEQDREAENFTQAEERKQLHIEAPISHDALTFLSDGLGHQKLKLDVWVEAVCELMPAYVEDSLVAVGRVLMGGVECNFGWDMG